VKILIVGGGLAGVCVAHEILRRDCQVTLIDSGINHSSAIAAGIINPMTFRKMVKTWMGDELIPFLREFYSDLEHKIGQQFFFERTIRRAFSTAHERELWLERERDEEYRNYIFPISTDDTPPYVREEFGTGVVKCPGYIDAKTFLDANQTYLRRKGILRTEEFDFDQLDVDQSSYNGERFDAIVFSEGYRGKQNPFFQYLPLETTKGEVLTLNIQGLDTKEIVNRKCFILPTHNGVYKLGATFTWKTTDISLTEEAKKELLGQYSDLIKKPFHVVDHEAGIRPTVADRRPLIGEHPKHKGIYIFNGMGTKGYMIAPYFARHFVEHLLDHHELLEEVSIVRFQKYFKEE